MKQQQWMRFVSIVALIAVLCGIGAGGQATRNGKRKVSQEKSKPPTPAQRPSSPAVRPVFFKRQGNMSDIVWAKTGVAHDAVAFSPDGQLLAAPTTGLGPVGLFRVSDGSLVRLLMGHTARVQTVAFSPDGQFVAAGASDNTARIWRVSDGSEVHTLMGHTARVESVAFSPDGQTLASGSVDRTVKLWRVSDGSEVRTLNHGSFVNAVAFSPDGQTLVSGENSVIHVWQLSDGSELRRFFASVNALALSPDGQFVAVGGADNTVKVFRVSDGSLVHNLTGHTGQVFAVAFSPDGQLIASGSGDRTIRLWQVSDGSLVRTLTGLTAAVFSVAFSPNGQTLASGVQDNTVRLWRVSDGNLLNTLTGPTGAVDGLAFSPDGQILATGSSDSIIRLWRASDGALLRTMTGHTFGVLSLAFSPDGQMLASSSPDRTIKLWRVSDGALLNTFTVHTDRVNDIAFSPNGQMIASVSQDRTVKILRVSDGMVLQTMMGHTSTIHAVAFSPDGQEVASGSFDRTVKIWRVVDGSLIHTLTGHTDAVNDVAYSPDGQTLASGSRDARVKLWRVVDGALIRDLLGHTRDVTSVDFSPNGSLLASGSGDATIRIWRVGDGMTVQTLPGHSRNLLSVAYSPDGQFIAAGWEAVTVWRVGAVANMPPSAPMLMAPADNAMLTVFPFNLQLSATDADGQRLTFKVELLQNGNVVRTFDQSQNQNGWNQASYASGETAMFTVSTDLTPGAYQWRAQAFDGIALGAVSATRSFTFAVEEPVLLTVSPNFVSNAMSARLQVTGFNFQSGLEVRLEKSGQPNIVGSNVMIEEQRVITAQFNLNGAAAGKWDVVVRNPNGGTGRLAAALMVSLPIDLVLEDPAIDPAQNLVDGQIVTAKAKLRNASGADAVGAIPVSFEAWGQKVTAQHLGGLDANGVVTISTLLTAKAGMGTNLRVTADPNNVVPESRDDNNAIDLSLPNVPSPDLTVINLEFEPQNPRSGDTVRLTAKVKNLGAKLLNSYRVAFFMDNALAASEPSFIPLETGMERDITVHVRARVGSATIRAKVDAQNQITESDETNNEFIVNLPPVPQPDLLAEELQLSPDAPTGGGWVSTKVKVKNMGVGEQGGAFTVDFRVDGRSIGRTTFTNSLLPGQQVVVNGVSFRAQPGQRAVTAVIDPDDEIAESNEQNNSAQKNYNIQPADLTLEDAQFEPQQIRAGMQVTVRAKVSNKGAGGAGAFLVGLFAGNTFITSQSVPSLASTSSQMVTLLYTAKPGVSALRVVADLNNDITESREDNNEASLSLPNIAPPDFVVSDISLTSASVQGGDGANVRATVRNNGAAFEGRVVVRIALNDTARRFVTAVFAPGSNTATADAQFPIAVSSTAFVIEKLEADVDPTNQFPEADEQNNRLTQAVNQRVEPPDLAVTGISAPSQMIDVGGTAVVMVEVRNLAAPCRGDFDLDLSVDGKRVGRGKVQFTGQANEQRSGTIEWEAFPGNRFNFRADVVVQDVVTANNTLEQTLDSVIQVRPVDLQITQVDFTPTSGVKLNEEVHFTVKVKNVGPGNIAKSFSVFLEVSGKKTKEGKHILSGLKAGEERTFSFTWVASEQARPRAVPIVDADFVISETDETNNARGVDLPFDVARVDAYEVSLQPSVGNGLRAVPTPVGVKTDYTFQVKSFITVPTIFDLTVEGLPSDWFSFSVKEAFLEAGEWKDVTLSVTPPANAPLGETSFQVKATRRGTSDSRTADGKANVVAKTEISDLLPEDNQTLPSDTVVFTWRTPVSSSSEVFLKREGTTNEQRFDGAAGDFHRVVASGLTVGARYQFRAQSTANGSTSTSAMRTITIGGGVAFTQKDFNFSVQRDYLQVVTVNVRNLSNQMMNALATVQNPFHPEIVVGFAGSGSMDANLQLSPNESKGIDLVIHAPTAAHSSYDLPVMVKSGPDTAPLTDVATVKVQVPLRAELELIELSTDPTLLTKKFRLINKGDTPVADIQLSAVDDRLNKCKVALRPDLQQFRLGPRESVEFEAVPLFQLAEHRTNAAFAAKLQVGRAQRVESFEAQRLLQQAVGCQINANSGAGGTSLNTNYNLNGRSIFAVPLANRHIASGTDLNVCTNRAHYDTDIPTPPIEEIDDPFLLVELKPRNPYGWELEPHDVFFKVNGYPVGSLNNTIPDGVYTFDVPASILNLSDEGTTTQRVEIETSVFNQAHYWRVGRMELHIFASKMVVYVAAENAGEALRIAQNQPYFAPHNDPPLDRYLAQLKAKVQRRGLEWRRIAWGHPDFGARVVWIVFEPFVPHGWLNNNMLLGTTDPQYQKAYRDFRCINHTNFILDDFIRERQAGNLPGLQMAIAQSKGGGHTFPIIWQEGTNPMETGIIIDPWVNQEWNTVPIKDALNAHWPSAYADFSIPQFPGNPEIFFHSAGTPSDEAPSRQYPDIKPDQDVLFNTWFESQRNQRILQPPSIKRQGQSQGEVVREPFLATAIGRAFPLVTDVSGNRVGLLPSGEFINELGIIGGHIETVGPPSTEEIVTSVRIDEGTLNSYTVTLASAGDQKATLVTQWKNASGQSQHAVYTDVPLDGGGQGAKQQGVNQQQVSGVSVTIDPNLPPPPIELADGRKIYPHILGEADAGDRDILTEPIQQIVTAGLSMITIPSYVRGIDPALILGLPSGELKLARWNPEVTGNHGYSMYPDAFASAMDMGKGYWILVPRTTTFTVVTPIARQDKPFAIPLSPGWNMVGNPFLSNVVWDLNAIKVRRNGQEMTLAQAQQAGLIEDFAWCYRQNPGNPNTGNYALIYDTSIIPNVANLLEAWRGCWVLAHVDCELVFPPPSATQASLNRALSRRKPSRNEWMATVTAEAGGATDSVSFGTSLTGRSRNKLQIIKPPAAPGGGGLEVSLVSADKPERLGVDVRRSVAGKERWDVIVRGAQPHTDVTLRWNDLGIAPRSLRFYLIDEATGARRYMRTTQGYTFRTAAGEERKFRIELDTTPATGRVLSHLNVINNGQGAHFSFVLSQPATVNARIITPTGKVAVVVARGMPAKQGLNVLTWNGKAASGAAMTRGVYIVEITAVTEEGQEMRDVKTLTMR